MKVGVDESHRGCIVGRLYVGVVATPGSEWIQGLADSKALSEERRTELAIQIKALYPYGIGWTEHTEIDELGVWVAEQRAIDRAISDLRSRLEIPRGALLIMDGNVLPKRIDWPIFKMQCVVKADAKYPEVMAASILAKTEADSWLSAQPEALTYDWATNHGYVNPEHLELIRLHGESSLRRETFEVRELMSTNESTI
jgi:ribonuclease HII